MSNRTDICVECYCCMMIGAWWCCSSLYISLPHLFCLLPHYTSQSPLLVPKLKTHPHLTKKNVERQKNITSSSSFYTVNNAWVILVKISLFSPPPPIILSVIFVLSFDDTSMFNLENNNLVKWVCFRNVKIVHKDTASRNTIVLSLQLRWTIDNGKFIHFL